MSNNLYLVFSEWPEEVSRDDYHSWYVDHAQENIESPGFVSAQRYSVRKVVGAGRVGYERHLAVYEYEGDMSTWRTDLSARIQSGDVVLPDWFPRIGFTSWSCHPEGGRLVPRTRD
jgi:hypothetical protein